MNPVLLQKQIRENAADLQDFCKDLKSWGEEMKRKETSLGSNNDGDKNPAKKVPKLDKRKTTKKHSSKIGATDYDFWSKFDADAECDKIDGDLDEDSELTDEIDETSRDQALLEKEKGNKFVKNQKWDEAIQSYTKAIDYYSFDPIFYANRALCYLKKNEYEKAIEDCTKSLRLDSTYVKAYQRRAAAYEASDKMDLAEQDLLKVLEYEPNNKESKLLLNKIRKKVGDIDKKNQRPISKFTASRNIGITPVPSKPATVPTIDQQTVKDSVSIWPEDDNIILVKSIKKPPHSRSKKPLKRIEIIETDNSAKTENEPVKKHVVIKELPEIITEEPAKTRSAFKQKRMEKNVVAEQKKAQFPKPDKPDIKTDDMKIVERKCVSPNEDKKELKDSSNLTIRKEEERIEQVLVAPKNYVQFNNAWRNFRTTEDKYKYLKIINPEDFPNIFQESLEANTFSDILQTLAQHFIKNNDPVYNYLLSLTKVKRFCTFTMFMEAEDKRNVWKLLDYIKEQKERPKENVDYLVAQYEL